MRRSSNDYDLEDQEEELAKIGVQIDQNGLDGVYFKDNDTKYRAKYIEL